MCHQRKKNRIIPIVFFATSILWFSCNSNKNTTTAIAEIEKLPGTNIKVFQTSTYCGGARPSPEILAELQAVRPFSDQMIYVKAGTRNDLTKPILDSAITNTNGEVRFNLSPGTYSIIRKERIDRGYYNFLTDKYGVETKNYSKVDSACLDAWIADVDFVIQVIDQSTNSFEFIIHHPCWWNSIPCVEYTGPIPN